MLQTRYELRSAVRVLADASEITGLPRDNFEIYEISKAEFETFRSEILAASLRD